MIGQTMKRLARVGIALAGAGAAAVWFWPEAEAAKPTIVRAPVSWGPVSEVVQAQGTLEPLRRVDVGSQVSGVVTGIYAEYNSVVKAGQLLAEIDPSLLQVQADIQQANIDRQKTDLASQQAQLTGQKTQYDRVRQLHARGLQTEQQLEVAALAVRNREAQLLAAKTQLVQAEANLSAAKLNVSYTKITSPIDGVIAQRRVNLGQTVQVSKSTPTLFVLYTSLQTLKLSAGVDEANIGRVRPGMEVRFTVGAYGSEMFTGRVEAVRLNASNSNSVVTYPVWIHVENDDLRLRPGMTVQAFIHVSEAGEVARIPNEALRFRPTRAVYQALGAPVPNAEPERAIDRAGDRVVDPTALRAAIVDGEVDTVDELFAPLPKADARGTVWIWDEPNRRFTAISVRVGVSDGSMSELLSGDLEVGDELVTSVVLPLAPGAKPAANPLMGPQRGWGGR